MEYTKPILFLAITFAMPFNVVADKIYKSVDESGAAFSYKQTPVAKQVHVNPNVIGTEVPVMPEGISPDKAPTPPPVQSNATELEDSGRGTTDDYNRSVRRRNLKAYRDANGDRPAHNPLEKDP